VSPRVTPRPAGSSPRPVGGMWALLALVTTAGLCLAPGAAWADGKGKPAPGPAKPPETKPTDVKPVAADSKPGDAKPGKAGGGKAKVFDFTGLDLNGRLRTPQLLYFLERASEELERASLRRRSFIPELVRSIDEESL
jgi:hypothetical protein